MVKLTWQYFICLLRAKQVQMLPFATAILQTLKLNRLLKMKLNIIYVEQNKKKNSF